jgi:protein-S-isoprenylcysteine O-methyltransferase Ste14
MSRDRIYGGLIFMVALIIAILYLIVFFAPYLGLPSSWSWWAVAIPIVLLVIAALAVCMWIGWTMLTTPPPISIESEALEPEINEKESDIKPSKE